MEPHVMAYDQLGLIAERAGSKLPGSSPNNLYLSADGCYIHVAALADPIFRRLSAAMDRPALADEARFATNRQRSLHGEAVDALVQDWIGSLLFETVHQRLTKYDIPHAKIYNIDDVFRDPHFSEREAIARLPHPKLGMVAVPNVTPRLSATPGHVNALGRETGADTAEVLKRLLGLDADTIATLQARGVISGCATAAA
jgi:crotonobetainyl-CoA:carnitine CoA-transferase CaiB-like acyl-CoA transferase